MSSVGKCQVRISSPIIINRGPAHRTPGSGGGGDSGGGGSGGEVGAAEVGVDEALEEIDLGGNPGSAAPVEEAAAQRGGLEVNLGIEEEEY